MNIESAIEEFQINYQLFLTQGSQSHPNTWLYAGDHLIKVYVQKGFHSINHLVHQTLDIANINISIPGVGIGTRIIDYMHSNNPFPVTYIESILNAKFYTHLTTKKNWIDVVQSHPPCVYKLTGKN